MANEERRYCPACTKKLPRGSWTCRNCGFELGHGARDAWRSHRTAPAAVAVRQRRQKGHAGWILVGGLLALTAIVGGIVWYVTRPPDRTFADFCKAPHPLEDQPRYDRLAPDKWIHAETAHDATTGTFHVPDGVWVTGSKSKVSLVACVDESLTYQDFEIPTGYNTGCEGTAELHQAEVSLYEARSGRLISRSTAVEPLGNPCAHARSTWEDGFDVEEWIRDTVHEGGI